MNTQRPRLHLSGLLVAAVFATVSGACMSVEAEAPEIEITQSDIRFQGVPIAVGERATKQTFTQDHPVLDLPKELTADIHAVQVKMIARSGVKDFDFLKSFKLTMKDDHGSLEPVELLSYQRSTDGQPGPVLLMPSKNPVNVLDHWKTKSATFTLDVEGTLPQVDWSIDLTLSFAGKARWEY